MFKDSILTFLVWALFTTLAHSQSISNFSGIITNESNQRVGNATIVLTQKDTKIKYFSVSDSLGAFSTQLPSGLYRVEISSVNYASRDFDSIAIPYSGIFTATLQNPLNTLREVVVKTTKPFLEIRSDACECTK